MPKIYVIYDRSKNQYIAVDDASGGYPYHTDWYRAKFWTELDATSQYRRLFHGSGVLAVWEIQEVELNIVRVL